MSLPTSIIDKRCLVVVEKSTDRVCRRLSIKSSAESRDHLQISTHVVRKSRSISCRHSRKPNRSIFMLNIRHEFVRDNRQNACELTPESPHQFIIDCMITQSWVKCSACGGTVIVLDRPRSNEYLIPYSKAVHNQPLTSEPTRYDTNLE